MTPDQANLSNSIQQLLDEAVKRGVAPGLAATVFDRTDIFASASAGSASVQDKTKKFDLDTIIWPASAAKPFVSLLALILVEKHNFDLDSHEELVKVLPELGKDYPGTRIWKIIDGKDENGEYKYRDAKVGITLRHLMTHSIGSALHFNSEAGKKFFDESVEKGGKTHIGGYIEAYNEPRAFEAGEGFAYGLSAEWLGQFVTRLGEKSFRKTAQELLFEPLNLPKDTIEVYRTPSMNDNLVEFAAKIPDGTLIPLPAPGFDTPQHEDIPPEGQSVLGNAPFWSSLRTFSQALRALLNKTAPSPGGTPLISEKLWKEATEDDYKRRGISINQDPFMMSSDPTLSTDMQRWSEIEGQDKTLGWNMFQQVVHRSPNPVGFRPNVVEWSGLANTYYFLDHERGVGAVITAQFFPWGDKQMIDLKNEFFKLVFEYSGKKN